MPNQLSGLSGLGGIGAISEDSETAFATPEQRYGGTADPFHGHRGETAVPYSWESQAVPGASHGPYGPENQTIGDEFWFLDPAGDPSQDPDFDYNTPSLTRSHASVHNVTISGPVPSQYDAINTQLGQMGNKASNLGTSHSMTRNSLGYAENDSWQEIWEVDEGNSDAPQNVKQFSHSAFGIGVNDTVMNVSRKHNEYGYGAKHMHRRYATGSIPGNYMWMRPQGRPLFKRIAGTAKLPLGPGSQFTGVDEPGNAKDIGFPFDPYGAVLQNTPTQYVPPPMPNIDPVTATYDDPYGTTGFEMY